MATNARLFGGGIATETNVFSPMPTGLHDFAIVGPNDTGRRRREILGGAIFDRFAAIAEARGCSYTQGTYAYAVPAGVTSRAAYETLRDALLNDLAQVLPVDGVLLGLHGAMVAEGYPDCEEDIVACVRALVGDKAKVGVLLDPHCDISRLLVELADAVVTYKEYPHVDIEERAVDLANLIIDATSHSVAPMMALFDCRMLGLYPTSLEPMRTFVDRMSEAERGEGILSVSLGHSFPWGDSSNMGARTLVISDGDSARAQALATQLGRKFFALRHEVSLQPLSMDEALDKALSLGHRQQPVVVADVADNAGGGAGGDSTFALRELLERRVKGVCVALLWDPVAVHQMFAAGVGSRLMLRLGGKMSPLSGDPLDVTGTVKGLVRGLVQRWPQKTGYVDISCGDCAWLRVAGVDVIVSSVRTQVFGLEPFTGFGINPAAQRLLVVKSSAHFRAAYEPIAAEVISMSTPGALTFDFLSIPYKHIDKNKYPWVDDPWKNGNTVEV